MNTEQSKRRLSQLLTCGVRRTTIFLYADILKQASLLILLIGPAFSQTLPMPHYEQLDELRAVKCQGELPPDFSCGILIDADLPNSNFISSLVGGQIRQLSVAISGTIYTAVYEPPLERNVRFFQLGKNARIPARATRKSLTVRWPDGTEATGRIIRREHVNPQRPQPA